MASESIGLDDIIATMLSMGFEFQDCQEAVTNGKLTVQAAIDWILAGKPGNVNARPAPSLNLTQGRNTGLPLSNQSNPFVPGNTDTFVGSSEVSQSSSSFAMGLDQEDDPIVSRSHLSEKQQQIKQDFEEKERQEARRKVAEEKLKKKKERERILKEIQEDREKQKVTKSQAGGALSGATAGPTEQPKDELAAKQGTENVSDTANIQVRLPSGQMFRQTYPASTSLNTVWDSVYSKIKTAMNAYSGFIQPFPRREFSKPEMGQSLKELGLVPSGSLVLKKRDVNQASPEEVAQPPAVMMALDQAEREQQEADDEAMEVEDDGHNWGRGNRVEGGEEVVGEDMVEQHGAGGYNPFEHIPGLGDNPILGNHLMGGPGHNPGGAFEGFGNRLVPEGVPGDHGNHLNRRASEMAAEAAAQRFALPRAPAEESSSHSELVYNVSTLQNSAMNLLAHRLTDPRQPIFSVSGLPEHLLQAFLAYLKKERLLKPKIMHLIPSYLLKLDLDYYPYTTNELLHTARIFVHLHILSLNSCSLITDTGLNCIKGMKALKVLNLCSCSQITDACFAIVKNLGSLQTLSLDGTRVTNAGVIQFSQSAQNLHLLHLDLSRTNVTHDIFTSLQNFKMLKSLILKQSKISSLSGVEGIVSLENLDVSETQIVTDSILCITRHPRLCNISLAGTLDVHGDRALNYLKDMKLTSLLLPSRSSTSNIGLSYISGFHLSTLDLTNYTNISNEGMVHVGKIISLKKLLLTNTKVSDEGVLHLKDLVHLEVLFLDRTLVTGAGASVVANFKNLTELSLSGTSVTGDFLKQGILNKCLNLTKLNLSRTIIGDKGIAELKVPYLQLLNLDCTRVHPYALSVIQTNCPNAKSITLSNLSSVDEQEENM
ncbi:uncharacterized protein LOC101862702 [Aplysia californica]|uniref:Uncharacterized protein LOC101862702 n=1 Tax=Aplysia californica TaxID=6500 RepID=A0ABM1ABI8_APLCA|nr:uncharacterized protein LOC101862702 [Aplysia californica]